MQVFCVVAESGMEMKRGALYVVVVACVVWVAVARGNRYIDDEALGCDGGSEQDATDVSETPGELSCRCRRWYIVVWCVSAAHLVTGAAGEVS